MFDFADVNNRDYIGIFVSLTSDFPNVNVKDYIGIFISLILIFPGFDFISPRLNAQDQFFMG